MVVLNINLKHQWTVTIIYAIRIKQDGILHKNFCNRYTENLDYIEIEFKYKGPEERYRIATNMPMLVTKNMRNKEMYNMQQYNIDKIIYRFSHG